MPAGPVHHQYHQRFQIPVLAISAAVFLAGLFLNQYVSEIAFWLAFWYWAGRYIDPDLDLQGVTMAEGRALRELDFAGVMLMPFTAFYAAFVAYIIRKFRIKGAIGGSHRTWLTHSLVPGTIGRMALVDLYIYIAFDVVNKCSLYLTGGWFSWDKKDILMFAVGQFIGLGIADLVHIILDKTYSAKGDDQ